MEVWITTMCINLDTLTHAYLPRKLVEVITTDDWLFWLKISLFFTGLELRKLKIKKKEISQFIGPM